ncbi:MAG: hypothetical protein Kow0069_06320 [Promethearchaeota archaeon]
MALEMSRVQAEWEEVVVTRDGASRVLSISLAVDAGFGGPAEPERVLRRVAGEVLKTFFLEVDSSNLVPGPLDYQLAGRLKEKLVVALAGWSLTIVDGPTVRALGAATEVAGGVHAAEAAGEVERAAFQVRSDADLPPTEMTRGKEVLAASEPPSEAGGTTAKPPVPGRPISPVSKTSPPAPPAQAPPPAPPAPATTAYQPYPVSFERGSERASRRKEKDVKWTEKKRAKTSPERMKAAAAEEFDDEMAALDREIAEALGVEEVKEVDLAGEVHLAPRIEKQLRRKATVFYDKQMNPLRLNKLTVVLSTVEIAVRLQEARVKAEKAASEEMVFRESSPFVHVEPVFPGCIVSPPMGRLDSRKESDVADFKVTPLSTGKIPEAKVKIWYEDQLVAEIPTPAKSVNRAAVKVSALLAVVAPTFTPYLDEKFGAFLSAHMPFYDLVGGIENIVLGLSGFTAFVSALVYYLRRPKPSGPVASENFDLDEYLSTPETTNH